MPGNPRIRSFPPLEDAQARILILGSMPGVASLRAGQYYAHPQNLFWRIVCSILGVEGLPPYEARVRLLTRNRIALWDVLASCRREGSLDSAIESDSIVANDFARFLDTHPRIARVCFNGAKAEATWRRQVRPALGAAQSGLDFRRLPSTSPAHAAMSYLRKRTAWREALEDNLND